MTKFQPQKGLYFYCQVRPRTVEHEDMFTGEVKTRVLEDRSYQGDVFYCLATDDTCIAAERVFGGTNFGVQLFTRDEYLFMPVGPDIMAVISKEFKHKVAMSD